MKKIRILTLIAITSMLSMAACSYQDFENKIREDVRTGIEGIDESGNQSGGENDPDAADGTSTGSEKEIAEIGDTVIWDSAWKTHVEYTVEKVETVENLNETQIKKEDFNTADVVREDGSFTMLDEAGDTEKCVFLIATVKVKNIDFLGYNRESEIPELSMEKALGLSNGLKNPQNAIFLAADYFSNHSKENREKDYFKYTLEQGEEIEVQIGWVIPEEKLQETLYYVIGLNTDDYEYFKLNEGEGGL